MRQAKSLLERNAPGPRMVGGARRFDRVIGVILGVGANALALLSNS